MNQLIFDTQSCTGNIPLYLACEMPNHLQVFVKDADAACLTCGAFLRCTLASLQCVVIFARIVRRSGHLPLPGFWIHKGDSTM